MAKWGGFGWRVRWQGVPRLLSRLRWNLDVGADSCHSTRNSTTWVGGGLRGGQDSSIHTTQLEWGIHRNKLDLHYLTVKKIVSHLSFKKLNSNKHNKVLKQSTIRIKFCTSALFLCSRSLRSPMR